MEPSKCSLHYFAPLSVKNQGVTAVKTFWRAEIGAKHLPTYPYVPAGHAILNDTCRDVACLPILAILRRGQNKIGR